MEKPRSMSVDLVGWSLPSQANSRQERNEAWIRSKPIKNRVHPKERDSEAARLNGFLEPCDRRVIVLRVNIYLRQDHRICG